MSYQHGYPPAVVEHHHHRTVPQRPATLTAAVWGGVLVGVLSLVGGIFMILNGRESIRSFVEDTVRETLGTDASSELIDAAIATELDSAYSTLVAKAVVAIVAALLVLVFALLARGGGLVARIGLAVTLVFGLCAGSGLQFADADVMPGASLATASVTPLLSVVTIVLLFLPATNRYAAARRGRTS